MNLKEFFELNWTVFILFVVFNLLADIGFLQLGGLGGIHMGFGPFDIFSFFNQLKCADLSSVSAACSAGDSAIKIFVPLLNIIWQYFLACLVVFVVNKLRKK